MRYSRLFLLPLLAAACSYSPPPVDVQGDDLALAALAGEWSGTYSSDRSGRTGSILFRLDSQGRTAFGDVLMIHRTEPAPPLDRDQVRMAWERRGERTQVLRITFVRAEATDVFGVLEPYEDPDCGCRLETSFSGRIDGDRVQGTFISRHIESGEVARGEWSVHRVD